MSYLLEIHCDVQKVTGNPHIVCSTNKQFALKTPSNYFRDFVPTANKLNDHALKAGWHYTRDNFWLCPDCFKYVQKEKKENG